MIALTLLGKENAGDSTTLQSGHQQASNTPPVPQISIQRRNEDDHDLDYYAMFAWFKALPFLILGIVGQAAVWILVFSTKRFYYSNLVLQYTFLIHVFQKQDADRFLPWIFVAFPFYSVLFTLFALPNRSPVVPIVVFPLCLGFIILWPLDTLCFLRPTSYDSACVLPWWFNYSFMLFFFIAYMLFSATPRSRILHST